MPCNRYIAAADPFVRYTAGKSSRDCIARSAVNIAVAQGGDRLVIRVADGGDGLGEERLSATAAWVSRSQLYAGRAERAGAHGYVNKQEASANNGHGSAEIAAELNVSQNTVGTHKENIRRKLGAKNSTELLQQAVRWVLENR